MEKTIKGKNYEFTPTWSGFDIKYHVAGYFDPSPMLQIYFIWGKLFLKLPWKHYKRVERLRTKKEMRNDKLKKLSNPNYKLKPVFTKDLYYDCDPPRYGIYYHHDAIWICLGKKSKSFSMPWDNQWIRTSALRIDGDWEHETKNYKDKHFWDDKKWKNILFSETYPYKYITKSGVVQYAMATIGVREREWRWKWFKWLKITRKISRDIDVNFTDEIGERKGSQKGGCTGCGYKMLKGETPYDTLKRMEKERKF